VIDPKGIVGPLGYDIAVFLNNIYWGQKDELDKDVVRMNLARAIAEFSAAFEIGEIDLRKWAFATQVLGAWWTFDEMPDHYDNEVEKADIWDV
jgi:streptomycin 6-kinase